jgi:hypothetical protein
MFTAILMSQKSPIDFEYVRLITKSLFHYYKYDEKEKNFYFIYQDIIKNIRPFEIWLCYEFWKYWYEIDIDEKKNTFEDIEEHYFNVLLSLANTMSDLKIDQDFIEDCILNNLAIKYLINVNFVYNFRLS